VEGALLVEPGNELGKVLAVVLREGDLLLGGLARAVSSDGTGTVLAGADDLGGVEEERVGVTKGHKRHAKVREGDRGGDGDGLEATMLLGGGEEDTGGLANEGTLAPVAAKSVNEPLDLGREGAEAGGNAEEETVSLEDVVGARVKDGDVKAGDSHLLGD